MNDFHVLIPARLGSQRLARKALVDIDGMPMIARVWTCAQHAGPKSIHVVTDSHEIAAAAEAVGAAALMTSEDHASGTDRLSEAVGVLGLDDHEIIVNLQGDEPLMPADCLTQVASLLASDPGAAMATLYEPFASEAEWRDDNVVKLVVSDAGRALCFSRAPIPHPRNGEWPKAQAKRHVGLYAYRVSALKQWARLNTSATESIEGLEQWRALTAGWSIVCAPAIKPIPAGVDSAADVERVRSHWAS